MWGQAPEPVITSGQEGIIPTRVGTRKGANDDTKKTKDHPHACGDKKKSSYCLATVAGSSPRVWGQVQLWIAVINQAGIIPTRVGTSGNESYRKHGRTDHPHACGDKFIMRSRFVVSEGSSPRVWGQVLSLPLCNGQGRIIPTRVGTSSGF